MCALYMLFTPDRWVTRVMQLTFMSADFACWLLALAVGNFVLCWLAEKVFFLRLAQGLGRLYTYLRPAYRKQRRQYKMLLDEMQNSK